MNALQIVTLAVQIVVAIILAVTVIFAFKSSRAAERMVFSQTLWQILSMYSSPEMHEGMKFLNNYWNTHGETTGKEFIRRKTTGIDWGESEEKADDSRRRFAHHFHNIKQLYDASILSQKEVKIVTNRGQIEFLRDKVKPLYESNADMGMFIFFENLYNLRGEVKS
jgi:hypothetical protein